MRIFKSLSALAGAALMIGAVGSAFASADGSQQPGVWEHHQATTAFFGQTSKYTCSGIEAAVKRVLLYFGARPDLQVTATCPDPIEPVRSAVVKTDFYSLQPAASGAGDTVNAQWVPIELMPQRPLFMSSSECELVYQMKDLLINSFSLRDLKYDAFCFPHSVTNLDYRVRGQVLKPEAHQ